MAKTRKWLSISITIKIRITIKISTLLLKSVHVLHRFLVISVSEVRDWGLGTGDWGRARCVPGMGMNKSGKKKKKKKKPINNDRKQ
jgi:hypothetical protein